MTTKERKAARRQELGLVKQSPEYKDAPYRLREVLDLLVQHYGPMSDEGVITAAAGSDNPKRKTIATLLGVCPETARRYLRDLVSLKLLVDAPGGVRRNGRGTKGGVNAKPYVMNPALTQGLSMNRVVQPVVQPVVQLVAPELLRRSTSSTSKHNSYGEDQLSLEREKPQPVPTVSGGVFELPPSRLSTSPKYEPDAATAAEGPPIGVRRERVPTVLTVQQQRQREYDDAYAESDDDDETFARQWASDTIDREDGVMSAYGLELDEIRRELREQRAMLEKIDEGVETLLEIHGATAPDDAGALFEEVSR
jgi:hypothetical protein